MQALMLATLSAGEECWYACADKAGYYGGKCTTDFCAEGELCCRGDSPYTPFMVEATDAGCGALGCNGQHCCTEVGSASLAHEGERCSDECVDERGALDPECRSGFCGSGGFCCLKLDQNPGSVNCGNAGCEAHHCCVDVAGAAAPVFHEAVQDCWEPCGFGGELEGEGRQGGNCPTRFCGAGLCCRADPSHPFDDGECGESGCWGYHCCVGAGSRARGGPPSLSFGQSVFASAVAGIGALLLVLCLLYLVRGDGAPAARGKDEAARQAAELLIKGEDAPRVTPPPAPSRAPRVDPPPAPPSTPAPPTPSVASGRFTFLTRSSSAACPGRLASGSRPHAPRATPPPAVVIPSRDATPSAASRGVGGLHTSARSETAGSPWKTFLRNFNYGGAEEPDWLRRAETEVLGGAGASDKA
jgi:hypothetical protein